MLMCMSDGEQLEIPQNVSLEAAEQDSDFGGLPKTILLVKLGSVPFTKGEVDSKFPVTLDDLKKIIEKFQRRGKDLTLDYNHGSLNEEASIKGEAPQAGWINELVLDPEQGLIGKVRSYTPRAIELARKKELPRYVSPAISFSDDMHPEEIHSIGLTNTPSFHNPEAILAANDLISKEQEAAKKKATIQSFKDLILTLKETHSIMEGELLKTVQKFSDFVKNDESATKDMVAFNDATLGKTTIGFADVQAEIFAKRDTLSGPQLLSWLNQRLQSAVNDFEKSALQSEIARLTDFQSKFPKLWEAGFTSGDAEKEEKAKGLVGVAVAPTPSPITMGFNDLGNVVGFSDINKIVSTVKELKAFKDAGDAFLKQHKVISFSDVSKAIMESETKLKKDAEAKDLEARKAKAHSKVQAFMDDGRLLESQRSTMEKLALESPEVFNDLTKTLKPRIQKEYNDLLTSLQSGSSEGESTPVRPTPDMDKRAQALGFRDWETYETQAKQAGCFIAFTDNSKTRRNIV